MAQWYTGDGIVGLGGCYLLRSGVLRLGHVGLSLVVGGGVWTFPVAAVEFCVPGLSVRINIHYDLWIIESESSERLFADCVIQFYVHELDCNIQYQYTYAPSAWTDRT